MNVIGNTQAKVIRFKHEGKNYKVELRIFDLTSNYCVGLSVWEGKNLMCGQTVRNDTTSEQAKEIAKDMIKRFKEGVNDITEYFS